jgi:hypothetical protein
VYVRQCIECGIIDPRQTFADEWAAGHAGGWRCEQCGATGFEPVVMIDLDEVRPTADPFE